MFAASTSLRSFVLYCVFIIISTILSINISFAATKTTTQQQNVDSKSLNTTTKSEADPEQISNENEHGEPTVHPMNLTNEDTAPTSLTDIQKEKEEKATTLEKPQKTIADQEKTGSALTAVSSTKEENYISVLFREQPVFKIFYLNTEQLQIASQKAKQATANLEKAMNAHDPLEPSSKLVNVLEKEKNSLEVRVRGYRITILDKNNQLAAGYKNTEEYKELLLTELDSFVSNEFKRLQVQRIALQFFLSVFFALMGFVIFHQSRMFFNRADLMIEEKRESLKPVVFLSETLISAHALGGLFTLFLVIGRVLSYIIIILTSLAAILGQFTVTRTAMSHIFSELFTQGIKSIQSMFEALPSFLLAVILLFGWNLSLKILDLFLKGVRSGRISWSFLQEYRIAVVRFWGTALSCVIFFPLIVAALFGRFNTPIETILIGGALVLLLATLPIFISIAAGSFVLWQGNLEHGQWIKIANKQGEVTDISLHKITIVPEEGGRIHIPMSQLLFKSFTEKREFNKREFHFKVQRTSSLETTLKNIESIFQEKNIDISLSCLSLSSTTYHLSLTVPRFSHGTRLVVLSTLSQAHDDQKIQLCSDLIEEGIF